MAFDIWVMLAVALACLPIFLSGREIARWEGAVFLGYYAAYVSYLILAAQQHDALHTYSAVMLGFVCFKARQEWKSYFQGSGRCFTA
jgi:cation:H+ antiporter